MNRCCSPAHSPWLSIEQTSQQVTAVFNGERIPFLPRDVTVLPIRNVTVEELARWILQHLLEAPELAGLPIRKLLVRVASGADQWARSTWVAAEHESGSAAT